VTTGSFLERIVAAKREEVRRLTGARAELEARADLAPAPRDLCAALRRSDRRARLRVLAEVKFRSPSKGPLRPRGDPARIAERYEAEGAAAISVLCDGPFFDGGWVDLELVRAAVTLPVLAKEFVLDEVQVAAARAAGADAVLVIVRIVSDEQLVGLVRAIRARGMVPVVEVASRPDLDRALPIDPEIVGVNCRDLDTFQLNPHALNELLPAIPDAAIALAMSGVADLEGLAATRADAVLVGEHLMRAPDPGAALRELLRGRT
jgi:indole-3-glycerol phosphate synthase